LALQGGGALGAYQGGVYQALAEAALHPDWVAGISIGAINAAIIAGNPPAARVDKLREFWELVSSPQTQWLGNSALIPGAIDGNRPEVSPLLKGDLARSLANHWSAASALWWGATGFFTPRAFSPWLCADGSMEATSYYDTQPLEQTLQRLIDFDRVNEGPMRLMSAPSTSDGSFVYFAGRPTALGPNTSWRAVPCRPAFRQSRSTASVWDGGSSRTRRWAGWWTPGRRRTRWCSGRSVNARGNFPQHARRDRQRSSTPAAPVRVNCSSSCSLLKNQVAGAYCLLPELATPRKGALRICERRSEPD
jgi:NTE family protein